MTARTSSPRMEAADAVALAIKQETAKRGGQIKPIEILKNAISAYQSFMHREQEGRPKTASVSSALRQPHGRSDQVHQLAPLFESKDAAALRRGTKASIDNMLFFGELLALCL